MKKVNLFPVVLLTVASLLTSCGNDENTIRVGASPTPHAEILNSDIVQDYVEAQGYKLKVTIYQDYVTPNKALNDEGIDANYFQHTPYLLEEVEAKGYDIVKACEVHYEPLNLYSKTKVEDFTNKTISIINDVSNVERALALLKANNIIGGYTMDGFNPSKPNDYITDSKVTLECLDPGLLANKVNDDGIAVIPGNYALTAWGASKSVEYKVLGESEAVAGQKANIIAVRKENLNSEKTKVLCDALSQAALAEFMVEKYGSTVVYSYKDFRL
ncbi:MAG: metal ABC transporter substrate-binding protein [Bacilli bacterium]|nr:metal ABC transporter substrate-binding protein [Bacilli bacterium]